MHGLLLFAPTLKLDGWSMPWHSVFLQYVRPLPVRLEIDLAERDPYGLKDERVRRLVVSSMQSGDSGAAGVFSTPMRSFAHFNSLVAAVKPDLGKVRQPALIVHPREDDMASLKNAQYLQANLGGLVDTLVLDDSYHIVTLDQQRHIVAERTSELRELGRGAGCGQEPRRRRVARGVARGMIASDRAVAPSEAGARSRRLRLPRSARGWSVARFQVNVSPSSLMPR